MELSIVIPVCNEEENVEPLVKEINLAVEPLGKSYEIVIVDDGSDDHTFDILARLHRQEPRLRVVRLKRNFGQTAALAAGVGGARGKKIVTVGGGGRKKTPHISNLILGMRKRKDLVEGARVFA